jgi:hypothetical protein
LAGALLAAFFAAICFMLFVLLFFPSGNWLPGEIFFLSRWSRRKM